MHVRTLGTLAGAAALLAMSGCTVSRKEYLNTAFGPGKSPETYRVGGVAPEPEMGTKVVLIRSELILEVAGSPASVSHAPSMPSSSAMPSSNAPPAGAVLPLPMPPSPGMPGGTPYNPTSVSQGAPR